MLPNENLHYFGLYGLLFGTLAIILMLYKWRGDKSMTLSLHAASHPSAYITMGIAATVTAIFIYPFFFWWFAPTLQLPVLFNWCIGIAAICQILIGWIPDKPGRLSRIHNILAFIAGAMIVPITIFIASSPVLSSALKYSALVYLGLSLLFIFLYFFVRSTRKHSLVYQMIFYWGFFTIILSAAYLR
ncbi:MAG: hypothetical protein JWP06_856 [Candidatus Saccharibacteria bacterium]|nr:hypothetical protein [Candidatus Saccharibacteria bacterium]